MAPRKLSDSDKQDITKLYCQPGETTSTLATKFGVSSSTVSRVLKQMLSDDDYAELMQWKRSGERGSLDVSFDVPSIEVLDEGTSTESSAIEASDEDDEDDIEAEETTEETAQAESQTTARRRSRRRSNAPKTTAKAPPVETAPSPQVAEPSPQDFEAAAEESPSEPSKPPEPTKVDTTKDPKRLIKRSERVNSEEIEESDVAAWVSEGLEAANDYEADDDDDDEDWDDDDEDWDDEAEDEEEPVPQVHRREALAILSFEDFAVKKPCYLVVDRLAELITCPLKDFGELGLIPKEEEQARTLPVFDNHRVARRFARRNQRIIKVPNGLMLSKTQQYLQAKGITRLLFDGQVYALT